MSKIEWTDETWNPVIGCSRVSEGCRHCYAEGMASRIAKMGQKNYDGLTTGMGRKARWTGVVRCLTERLDIPMRWRKPRKVFVNSMSDLFHPDVPFEFIATVFGVMAACPQHTFQVLTKRPERAAEFFEWVTTERPRDSAATEQCVGRAEQSLNRELSERDRVTTPWPLPNVHLGVSVESQKAADERIPHLLRCPAAVRWVSAEPLLGPVELGVHLGVRLPDGEVWRGSLPLLDWVVCGGESGPGARPMHPDWARSLRDQCADAGVAFNFKQWGAWAPREGASYSKDDVYLANNPKLSLDNPDLNVVPMERVGKSKTGRILDGLTHDGYPEERR